MVGYMACYVCNLKHSIKFSDQSPIVQTVLSTNDPNYNVAFDRTTNTVAPTIISTNQLPQQEFFQGEIVGIKYFGLYGVVVKRTLGLNGYVYTIRWENSERDLDEQDFFSWELFRPSPGTVSASAFIQ